MSILYEQESEIQTTTFDPHIVFQEYGQKYPFDGPRMAHDAISNAHRPLMELRALAVEDIGLAAKRMQLAQTNHTSAIHEILRAMQSDKNISIGCEVAREQPLTVSSVDVIGLLATALVVDSRTGNPPRALDSLSDELCLATQLYYDALGVVQDINNQISAVAPH